jgi:hypothetical protein
MDELTLKPIIYHVPMIIGDSDEYYTYYIGQLLNRKVLGVPVGSSKYAVKFMELGDIESTRWFITTNTSDFNYSLAGVLNHTAHGRICPNSCDGFNTQEEALAHLKDFLKK